MQTIVADAANTKLRELIEAAALGPVAVIENGHPALIALSPAEYERLEEPARRQAKARLRETVAAMRAEAAAKGLTEAELERLLADES